MFSTHRIFVAHYKKLAALARRYLELAERYNATLADGHPSQQDAAATLRAAQAICEHLAVRRELASVCEAMVAEYGWMADVACRFGDIPEVVEALIGAKQRMQDTARRLRLDDRAVKSPVMIRGTDLRVANEAALRRLVERIDRDARHTALMVAMGPLPPAMLADSEARRQPDISQTPDGQAAAPKLYLAAVVAGQQYQEAVEKAGTRLKDDDAYDWVRQHCKSPHNLPGCETWKRHLRSYRKATCQQKNSPRTNMASTARSIIREDEVSRIASRGRGGVEVY